MNEKIVPVAWRCWIQFKTDGVWAFTDKDITDSQWGWEPLYAAAPEPATTVAGATSNELELPLPKHPSMPNHSISEPVTPDPMTIEGMIASERKRTEPAA